MSIEKSCNGSTIEILETIPKPYSGIKVAVFDFDGTISTLRYGWEGVMEPLMMELISNGKPITDELVKEVTEYIDQSTGIQTIFQMQWLADAVKRHGNNPEAVDDPWWYKKEYNNRLMEIISKRIKKVEEGIQSREDYLIKGSIDFLEVLKRYNIEVYAASGTDHPDVLKESACLGIYPYFTQIAGAPVDRADCSKEAVLRNLIKEKGLKGPEVLVIGDGKVEIKLGREMGAVTLGIASNEENRQGINEIKRKRLINARAHAIIGDFENIDAIMQFLRM